MTIPGSLYAMAELFKLLFKPGEGRKTNKSQESRECFELILFEKYFF